MNVLITGIDGFVGSHLTRLLLAKKGVRLFGLVRYDQPIIAIDPAVTLLRAEITDPDEVRRVITEAAPQKIFHLAGQAFVPHSLTDPASTFQVNVNGVLNILESVRVLSTEARRIAVLIVSSGEVYGDIKGETAPLTEETPLRPLNPYAVSKACADMISRQYRSSFGVDVTVVRPFNHLGPGQNELFVGSAFAKQIAEISAGLRPPTMSVGNLAPKRDFTDVRDVVQAYDRILDLPEREAVYNVCSGRAVSIREMLDMMIAITGVNVDVVVDPERTRKSEVPVITGDASRLRSVSGWEPSIPIETTLRDLLDYWKERIQSGK